MAKAFLSVDKTAVKSEGVHLGMIQLKEGTLEVHMTDSQCEGDVEIGRGIETVVISNCKIGGAIHFDQFPGAIVIDFNSYQYGKQKEGRNVNSICIVPEGHVALSIF